MNAVWNVLEAPKLGVAVYNFVAKDGHQLSLQFGDLVQIVERCPGWYRGFLYYQPSKQGIFPISYVHLKSDMVPGTIKKRKKTNHTDLIVQQKDHLVVEIEESLREWKPFLWKFFVEGPQETFQLLLQTMRDMLSHHLTIIAGKLEATMKPKIIARIDYINHKVGLNAVPRNEQGLVIDPREASFHLLYETYKSRSDDIKQSASLAGTMVYKKTASVAMSYHLYLSVVEIDHHFNEDVELFFRLYDAEKKEFISEPYAFVLEKKVMDKMATGGSNFHVSPAFQGSGQKHALFTDLGGKDIYLRNIYLVCHVVRNSGRILYGEKKYSSNHTFRRPYGCAVFDLLEIMRVRMAETPGSSSSIVDEHQCAMPIFVCAAKDQLENDFGTYHDHIIKSKTKGKSSNLDKTTGIGMLIRCYHGSYNDLCHDHPVLASKNLHIIHKLGFPDIILPGINRNDVYITLERGEYDKGTKTAQKNVEVAVVVVNDSGEIRQNAITVAEGLPPVTEYRSVIYYHNNKPRWNEMFKLAISIDELPNIHLRFTFRHLAKQENKDKAEKTFLFAFFKVMRNDGSIISDGQHRLCVFKAEHKKWADTKTYLSHVACKEDLKQIQGTLSNSTTLSSFGGGSSGQSHSESFFISIMTCSTKLTQKIELLSLLKWRQQEKQLEMILKNLMSVDGTEMVKFLQDTLDSLFEILVQNAEQFRKLVFDVLVHIIVLLAEKMYSHFLPVLDIYITKHFSATLAYKQLLFCLDDYVRHANKVDGDKLSKTLSALEYIFRFMIQSHLLYSRHMNAEDSRFVVELKTFFQTVNSMMALHSDRVPQIHEAQNVTLLHLASVLPDIKHVFTHRDDTAKLVSDFLNSIRNTHHILPASKLQFILNVLDSSVNLLQYPTSRSILIPTLVGHLMSFVNNTVIKEKEFGDNSVRGMKAIGRMLESLHMCGEGLTREDVTCVTPLVHPLLSLCQMGDQGEQIQQLALINFVALIRLFNEENFTNFLNSFNKRTEALKQLIKDVFKLFLDIIKGSPYHVEWEALHLIQNKVILRTVRNFSVFLRKKFFDEKYFNFRLCQLFFSLCMSFITQGSLKVEELSDFKKYKHLVSFGDLRVEMSQHVSTTWLALRAYKAQFIPKIIVTMLEMSLVKQTTVRLEIIPLIFDIIICEQQRSMNFKMVEKEIFDKMDNLFSTGLGDGEYKELFVDIMTQKCNDLTDKTLADAIIEFTASVKRLIELILDYRNVPTGDGHKIKRMGCMLNLLNFYQDIDKEDLYTRYIYKLSELHEREQNYTEAGFTLLLHADKLKWTEDILLAEGRYPEQMESERKEQLYMNAIGFFNEGKTWECGIRLCKELSEQYEKELFDYHKLAAILETEARFFRNIITELRIVEPEYFRVSYYGNGFPYFLRNRTCVHRGKPYQKLGSFISMLTNEFPSAQILKHNKPVEDDVKNSTGMCIQLCRVQPIEEPKDIFKGKNVDINILKYYKVNDVRRFKFDRPFHKGTKDPQNEFATLWFERTTMTTSDSFPGVIDGFEVTESETVELAPLEVAIETVETKNSELSSMIDEFTNASNSKDVNPLSMLLNGVVDAAVQGGTVQYKKLFLTAKYQKEHPSDAELLGKLKTGLEEQTTLCRKGLDIHGSRITSSLHGLHQKLEGMYKTMCSDSSAGDQVEIRRKSASMRRPLPETPLDKAISDKSLTLAGQGINRSSRAISQMVERSRFQSGNVMPMKSPSVSAIPESKRLSGSGPREELVDESNGIYEVTTNPQDLEDYEFVDPTKLRESRLLQDDIYQVPTSLNTSNVNEEGVYGFDRLGSQPPKGMSPIQNRNKKPPTPAVSTPDNNDIYSFDQLTPASQTPKKPDEGIYEFDQLTPVNEVPRKSSNSSSDKEDLQHVHFSKKSPKPSNDVYSFDHLDAKTLQKLRQQKLGYDLVPLRTPKSKSPSPIDEPQDDYIEPLDGEVMENIKKSKSPDEGDYHRLSKLMVDKQQPPQLPKKKKTESVAANSPVRSRANVTLGQEGQPSSNKYRDTSPSTPIKTADIANDGVPPPLPTKRGSAYFEDAPNITKETFDEPSNVVDKPSKGTPTMPLSPTATTTTRPLPSSAATTTSTRSLPSPATTTPTRSLPPPATSATSSGKNEEKEAPPPLPSKRSSASFEDVPPIPVKQDTFARPRESVRIKNPTVPHSSVVEEKPIPKQRTGSISIPAAPPLPKKTSQILLPAVESDYSVLGPEDNDTGPAATMMTPPQLPVKGSSNNKPRLPSPPPPNLPPKAPNRPLPALPIQPQQPLVQKPGLPPKNKPPAQSPSRFK